jgi:hypothetical protein
MSDLYTEEEDENISEENGDTILLADFEWKPLPEITPWTDPDFAKKIAERIKGVTEESFAEEVEIWQFAIASLPVYNEFEIRREIATWDISIPNKHDFDFEAHAAMYALQVQYRTRLSEIIAIVYAHYEMIFQAHKNLREIAMKLTNGTKPDKDAVATFTVSPFSVALSHAKRLLSYTEAVLKNIDFAATQMDRLMREHQALSRINQNFNNEGLSTLYSKDRPSLKQYNNDSASVRTRNGRMK